MTANRRTSVFDPRPDWLPACTEGIEEDTVRVLDVLQNGRAWSDDDRREGLSALHSLLHHFSELLGLLSDTSDPPGVLEDVKDQLDAAEERIAQMAEDVLERRLPLPERGRART